MVIHLGQGVLTGILKSLDLSRVKITNLVNLVSSAELDQINSRLNQENQFTIIISQPKTEINLVRYMHGYLLKDESIIGVFIK